MWELGDGRGMGSGGRGGDGSANLLVGSGVVVEYG